MRRIVASGTRCTACQSPSKLAKPCIRARAGAGAGSASFVAICPPAGWRAVHGPWRPLRASCVDRSPSQRDPRRRQPALAEVPGVPLPALLTVLPHRDLRVFVVLGQRTYIADRGGFGLVQRPLGGCRQCSSGRSGRRLGCGPLVPQATGGARAPGSSGSVGGPAAGELDSAGCAPAPCSSASSGRTSQPDSVTWRLRQQPLQLA